MLLVLIVQDHVVRTEVKGTQAPAGVYAERVASSECGVV